MPTFGFSALLKLISLNPRPQKTLIRKRLSGPRSKGYDYHRSLRLLANQHIVDGTSLEEVLRATEKIKQDAERTSAQSGLKRLAKWRALNSGPILQFEPVMFESPTKNFKVQFQPDFGIQLGGETVAVHIWNTISVELDTRMTYAALSQILPLYADLPDRPDEVGVLSLPDLEFYRLGEAGDYLEVGLRLVRRLDDLFEEIRRGPDRPGAPPDRPTPPPTR